MFIIPRYISRMLIGPFFFSLFTITFIFLTNFLIQNLYRVLGKGLSLWQILEYIGLNIPWIIALAGPMSLLVAVLMVFGKLSQDNEYTALKACGYSLYKILAYVMIAGTIAFYLNFLFKDRVLPESNYRLSMLISDIRNKKPAISFEEGIFSDSENGIPGYRILFRKIAKNSPDVEGVMIFDYTERDNYKIIMAESGTFTLDYQNDKMILDLYNGEVHETLNETYIDYKRNTFKKLRKIIEVPNLSLKRTSEGRRHDRTMTIKMMWDYINSVRNDMKMEKKSALNMLEKDFRDSYKIVSFLKRIKEKQNEIPEEKLKALSDKQEKSQIDIIKNALVSARVNNRNKANVIRTKLSINESYLKIIDTYKVEIYKTYSIPAACFVFVLIGIPLGLMAKSGKIGVSGGISLIFFLIYWTFLIGGEELADRRIVSPFLAMWSANILIGIFGVILTYKTAKEMIFIDFTKLKIFIPKRFRH